MASEKICEYCGIRLVAPGKRKYCTRCTQSVNRVQSEGFAVGSFNAAAALIREKAHFRPMCKSTTCPWRSGDRPCTLPVGLCPEGKAVGEDGG